MASIALFKGLLVLFATTFLVKVPVVVAQTASDLKNRLQDGGATCPTVQCQADNFLTIFCDGGTSALSLGRCSGSGDVTTV